MNKYHQINPKKAGVMGAVFGGLLISLPAIPLVASAQSISQNPCPGIYYEEPYNSTRLVPQGCTPNVATQRNSMNMNRVPTMRTMGTPAQESFNVPMTPLPPQGGVVAPLPETRSEPIATVIPMDGMVSVKVKNNTNAIVSYEAVGHTQRRFLPGGEATVLQNLPTPVTITMVRQDSGLIEVIPVQTSDAGMLEVSLQEKTTLDSDQGALRIQADGQVFLN